MQRTVVASTAGLRVVADGSNSHRPVSYAQGYSLGAPDGSDGRAQLYTIAVDGTDDRQLTIEPCSYGTYSRSSYPASGS